MMPRIRVVDSHTGGEPTRLVLEGGPDPGKGSALSKMEKYRDQFDRFRCAIINEPRGTDVLVGAWLADSEIAGCTASVIFFNNVGYLGMCGHGMIGVVATLAHLGRIQAGGHRWETPVGTVSTTLHPDGRVSIANVESFRKAKGVAFDVPGVGRVTGDVAWGGNWFFLVKSPVYELSRDRLENLTEVSWKIRQAVNAGGFPEVDHVELFGPAQLSGGNSRNFVLCPGKAYDRSPCGTGTSAKLACLAADGELKPGDPWVQESIIGSRFIGRYQWADERRQAIHPVIEGRAWVMSESTLLLDAGDPFAWGIS